MLFFLFRNIIVKLICCFQMKTVDSPSHRPSFSVSSPSQWPSPLSLSSVLVGRKIVDVSLPQILKVGLSSMKSERYIRSNLEFFLLICCDVSLDQFDEWIIIGRATRVDFQDMGDNPSTYLIRFDAHREISVITRISSVRFGRQIMDVAEGISRILI